MENEKDTVTRSEMLMAMHSLRKEYMDQLHDLRLQYAALLDDILEMHRKVKKLKKR